MWDLRENYCCGENSGGCETLPAMKKAGSKYLAVAAITAWETLRQNLAIQMRQKQGLKSLPLEKKVVSREPEQKQWCQRLYV